VHQGAPE
jgi:chemosensory pili system protein ChpA (sensor histidine kinase/response regulator)